MHRLTAKERVIIMEMEKYLDCSEEVAVSVMEHSEVTWSLGDEYGAVETLAAVASDPGATGSSPGQERKMAVEECRTRPVSLPRKWRETQSSTPSNAES